MGGGVGGGAPDEPTSLDKQSVIETSPVPVPVDLDLTRGRSCGSFTLRGRELDGSQRFYRLPCKGWKCSRCGPKKAKHYRHAISRVAEELRLCRFMTLTLDPRMIVGESVNYLNECWAELRTYLRRKYRVSPQFIRVLEFHKNGKPHLHILIDRYVDIDWLKAAWIAVGGGQERRCQINIKFVDVHRVARYVSKYLSKELLLSAPKKSRRVTTSRGVHLNEKREPSSAVWKLERRTINGLFEDYAAQVIGSTWDGETLESFSLGPPRAPVLRGEHFNLFD